MLNNVANLFLFVSLQKKMCSDVMFSNNKIFHIAWELVYDFENNLMSQV